MARKRLDERHKVQMPPLRPPGGHWSLWAGRDNSTAMATTAKRPFG